MNDYQSVLNFWFKELGPSDWFGKNKKLDQEICTRFGKLHFQARSGELYEWRKSSHGRLAEIIILDQFSRNIFRDEPGAFSCDSMALALAQECIAHKLHESLNDGEKKFLYMPYMHSESSFIHNIAVELFTKLDDEKTLEFELAHKRVIDRFGRYPHRNEILKRDSTDEEIAFLKEPNSSF